MNRRHRVKILDLTLMDRIREGRGKSFDRKICDMFDEQDLVLKKKGEVIEDYAKAQYKIVVNGDVAFRCNFEDVLRREQVKIVYKNYMERKINEVRSSASCRSIYGKGGSSPAKNALRPGR